MQPPRRELGHAVAVDPEEEGGRGVGSGQLGQVMGRHIWAQDKLEQPRLPHARRADDRARFPGVDAVEERRGELRAIGDWVGWADFGHG